jgi:hypothetical protein
MVVCALSAGVSSQRIVDRAMTNNNNDVYMMVTSSNAVKLEQDGLERDTVDNIINLFPH